MTDTQVATYGDLGFTGWENTTADDFKTPFLRVLQKGSPEVEEHEGKPDEAQFKAGMIINTATGETYKEIDFVVATTVQNYTEWLARAPGKGGGGGKGFVAVHEVDSEVVKAAITANGGSKFGKLKTPEGNDLMQTFNVFGVAVPSDSENPDIDAFRAITSFASTAIPHYQLWTAVMNKQKQSNGVPYPRFAHKFTLTTEKETDGQNTWYNFHPVFANGNAEDSRLPAGDPLVRLAVETGKSQQKGLLLVDHSKSSGADAKSKAADVPF